MFCVWAVAVWVLLLGRLECMHVLMVVRVLRVGVRRGRTRFQNALLRSLPSWVLGAPGAVRYGTVRVRVALGLGAWEGNISSNKSQAAYKVYVLLRSKL